MMLFFVNSINENEFVLLFSLKDGCQYSGNIFFFLFPNWIQFHVAKEEEEKLVGISLLNGPSNERESHCTGHKDDDDVYD